MLKRRKWIPIAAVFFAITLIAAGFDEEDDGEIVISSDPVFEPKQIKTPAPADNPPEKKKIVVDDDEFSVPPFLRQPRR